MPSLIKNDATRDAIADLPDRLADELQPDDSLVFFFAGHGENREREAPDPAVPGRTYTHRTGYLIPIDGPASRPGGWIELDSFLDALDGLPARHIFVILDACKSGIALGDKFKVKGSPQPAAVAELRRHPSRRVLTSARHDEKALDGAGARAFRLCRGPDHCHPEPPGRQRRRRFHQDDGSLLLRARPRQDRVQAPWGGAEADAGLRVPAGRRQRRPRHLPARARSTGSCRTRSTPCCATIRRLEALVGKLSAASPTYPATR